MTEKREFKIKWWHADVKELKRLDCPKTVPWGLLANNEYRIHRNHRGHTLEYLNERGGLTPREMVAVIGNRHRGEVEDMPLNEAVATIKVRIALYLNSYPS